MTSLPDSVALRLLYYRMMRHWPDLKKPRTFNEKVNWRKLYQRDPRFTLFADKIAVKDEIAKIIGKEYIIPTLWVGDDPRQIPFGDLPIPYVIKTSHSNDSNVFIRSKEDIKPEKIIEHVSEDLKYEHGKLNREWSYFNVPRRILIEKMISGKDGAVPSDYKFFVFHGKVHFIQVDIGRFGDHTKSYYDRDYNLLQIVHIGFPNCPNDSKPDNLGKMIELAEKVGSPFDFVRVDFYDTPDGIFFGECTFYPGAGLVRFGPESADMELGSPWYLNTQK